MFSTSSQLLKAIIPFINTWWKTKAIRRYTTLFNDNRIKPEILFYDDLVDISWEECKDKYISEVGR